MGRTEPLAQRSTEDAQDEDIGAEDTVSPRQRLHRRCASLSPARCAFASVAHCVQDDESMEEAGRRSPPEMHQNLMSRWDEVVHKMEQVQAKQQPTPTSPKASPHTSSSNLKEATTPGAGASPIAAREWAEQSPKRDEDQRDRRNSRASESGSESGAHPALPCLHSPPLCSSDVLVRR